MKRKQPRRVARELVLLSQGQMGKDPEKISNQALDQIVLAAVRTLTHEVEETIENAAQELKRGQERLLSSETRATSLNSAKTMVSEAVELTETAMNRLGYAIELPEFLYIANLQEVRDYTVQLLTTIVEHREKIDDLIRASLVDWNFDRLPKIDRSVLRIAVAEMVFLDTPLQIAINEAVELGKRYSDEEGYRFLNGVLRRVSKQLTINK
ncbi:transcription antitermination factor NusB [Dactylococcopsis salina]|uniref:Transcription antitermination protein NusB n=1 Tax=Dactylococcopsis salina (strain PCC 8305) TaxID=13035 RepID=K9YSG9_DACS8|nr:transcription antitermination factor NusB [Dactylococcopsis salina]AFZ49452.1 transcription antitermination factor NusB [Dactylococcopsis salina PCC 8305]